MTLIGLEMDEAEVMPHALQHAIASHHHKVLFLDPTLQTPTTLSVPGVQRLALAEILQVQELPLIENDTYGFIPARPPAPIATTIPDLTRHIGRLSKCI